jgi:hypothetical protein
MKAITPAVPRLGVAVCAMVMLLLCGCHKAVPSAQKSEAGAAGETTASSEAADAGGKEKAAPEAAEEGLTLKPEEIEKMGIVTTDAPAITSEPEASGFAVVMPHETVATAVAEIRTALAAERQSRSALERTKRLAGTPGAMPADTQETAERQAMADRAALDLARQRLSATFGQSPPWKTDDNSQELLALASGKAKLIRVTFPLGSIDGATPKSVRLARLDNSQGAKSWQAQTVWRAPADSSVPGKSFFAVLKEDEAGEGDHLMAWAPVGAAEPGALVPTAAILVSAGKYWCYVEEKPGTFVRTEIDPSRPVPDGYFVKEGISPGDKIVTAAAGQLLARETNPSTEPE